MLGPMTGIIPMFWSKICIPFSSDEEDREGDDFEGESVRGPQSMVLRPGSRTRVKDSSETR